GNRHRHPPRQAARRLPRRPGAAGPAAWCACAPGGAGGLAVSLSSYRGAPEAISGFLPLKPSCSSPLIYDRLKLRPQAYCTLSPGSTFVLELSGLGGSVGTAHALLLRRRRGSADFSPIVALWTLGLEP